MNFHVFKKIKGIQGPQKLSSIKPSKDTWGFTQQPSEMASLSNSMWQTVKNFKIDPQTTEISSKKLIVSECVCDMYLITEKLSY